MDVTRLLNDCSAGLESLDRRDSVGSSTPSATGDTTAPSTAVATPERTPPRRTSGSRSPARNRTPWDGNGFALPLTIDTKASIPSRPEIRPHICGESPTDDRASASPNSPGHKYSASHSSLSSSYTSTSTSTNSGSHSRISSLSTVSEFQPQPQPHHHNRHLTIDTTPLDCNRSTTHNNRKMADNVENDESRRRLRGPHGLAIQRQHIDLTVDERPQSPSDRVVPRRGQAGRADSASPLQQSSSKHHSPSHDESRDDSPASVHRRTISAPNLAANATPSSSQAAVNPTAAAIVPLSDNPSAGPALPSLAQQDQAHPHLYLDRVLIESAIPRLCPSEEDLMREINFMGPRECKYMDDCDLSKPGARGEVHWRKAMSHIFGRNKNCTRSIPENLWICWCRKHYQRARYRNGSEYNCRLIVLVEFQILRIEAWSNMNRRNGTPEEGVVTSWTLMCRRREQLRLEEQKTRKRTHRIEDDEEPYDEEDDDEDGPMPSTSNIGHVPDWLLEKCRPGYTTAEIQQIVARISYEVHQKILSQVPDIEILPNITGENAKPKSTRAKARVPVATHKRAQSMGGAPRARRGLPFDASRRVSQPNAHVGPRASAYHPGDDGRPTTKRQRHGDFGEDYYQHDRPADDRYPPRTMDRLVPAVRPPPHSDNPHSRVFHGEDSASGNYDYDGRTAQLPMRPSFYAGGARGGYDDYRAKGPHQRAFSDAGFSFSATPYGPAPAATGYTEPPNGYTSYYPPGSSYTAAAPDPYTREYARHDQQLGMNPYFTPWSARQQQQPPAYRPQQFGYFPPSGGGVPPPAGAAKHARHQSTPVVPQRMMGPPPPPPMQPSTSAQGADAFGAPHQHAPNLHDRFDPAYDHQAATALHGGQPGGGGRHASYGSLSGAAGVARAAAPGGGGGDGAAREHELDGEGYEGYPPPRR